MKSFVVATLTLSTAVAQDKPHCPQLKYDDGKGGSISLLQKWKGIVLSADESTGKNLTQANLAAEFSYVTSSNTLMANVTYTDKALTPTSCTGTFEIGCIAATPLDYTFKFLNGDSCFTEDGPWKCDAFLT
jgi:hypothetical protein